jgi:PAS domain S-box-containing protein
MRVLIAEDNELSRRTLEKLLTKWGYEVIEAKDGEKAWQYLQGDSPPDLAILDWLMPVIDGVEICRRVRQTKKYSPVYLMLLSANDSREHIILGLDAGADDYITKPFEYKELRARVRVGQRIVELQTSLDARIKELEKTKEKIEQANNALMKEILVRKQREEELGESERKIRAILENIEDGYFEADLTGNLTFLNDSYCKIFEYPMKDLMGMNYKQHMDQENAKKSFVAFNGVYKTGQPIKGFDYTIFTKDGTIKHLETSVTLKRDIDGKRIGFRGVVRDISERKALELQLQQAQKLESVGQLAAGIAHEINTPAQFVGDNIKFLEMATNDLLELQLKQGRLFEAVQNGNIDEEIIETVKEALVTADMGYLEEEIPKAVEQAHEGIARISKIVRAMKEFSHPGVVDMTNADINKAIETTITVARNEWKYVAEMETHLDPDIPMIPCMVSEINQVLLNLIINAAHAIKDVVGNEENEKGVISITTSQQNGGVEVRVSDTGTGIPKKIQGRIFEPFFTTKEVGKGSGQGLAMAHHVIVQKHHGELTFETEEGKGTTFIFQLPVSGNME